jgi:hypothetical protein
MTELRAAAPRDAGRMTAAMRVYPLAANPRVLRVALARHGQVVEERLLKRQADLTVGSNEHCTFVLDGSAAPPTLRLFEYQGDGYRLNLMDGMRGTIVLAEGPREIGTLCNAAHRRWDGSYQVRLPEGARGKLVLGPDTILFQLVEQPAPPLRPQLPSSVRNGLASQIDWRFTVISAFSFVLHFGLLGILYSDWADTQIDEVATITGVVDTVASLPQPPPEWNKPVMDSQADNSPAAQQPNAQGGPQTGAPRTAARGQGAAPTQSGKLSDRDRAAMVAALDQNEFAVLTAYGSGAPATNAVLNPGERPTGNLDEIARNAAGVRFGANPGLNLGTGDGRVAVGQRQGFESLVPPPTATAATTGSAVALRPPPRAATVEASPQTTGTVRNVGAVVARMSGGFRNCYQRVGLSADPSMEGSVRVTAVIGSNGEVQSAVASPGGTISGAVASCIASHVRSAVFDPPAGGMATVVIPIQLRHQ